jgi:phage gp36-like protein
MSYGTVEEFLGRLDAAYVTQLTTATPEGDVDEARVQRALDDATAELDGYLPRLPIEKRPGAPTLRLHCFKVTTYLLTLDRPGKEYEQIRNAYTDTIEFYKALLAEAQSTAGSPLGVSSEAPDPAFTDETLSGLVP